jgi:hypothetical protein
VAAHGLSSAAVQACNPLVQNRRQLVTEDDHRTPTNIGDGR